MPPPATILPQRPPDIPSILDRPGGDVADLGLPERRETTMSARTASFVAVAILALGCGGAGSNQGVEVEGEPAPVPEPEAPAAPDEGAADDRAGPVGSWENGSCGEREYNRRVNFLRSGNFTAIDAVAPCPPNAQCVWSGIIRWSGTWKLEGDVIQLAIKPIEGEKLPEAMPTEFVVLGRDPFSIGERIGDLVCPYRRID
jgi:hypothetical protein